MKNTNTLKKICCLTFSILLIFMINFFTKGIDNNFNFAQSNDNFKITSENILDLKNINSINFNLNIDDIKFLENDDYNLKIIEKCNRDLNENEKLNIKVTDSCLNIYRENIDNITANSFGESFDRELIVYLPKVYNRDLNISNHFGDIDFNLSLSLNNVKINLSNGNVNFNNKVKCESFILKGSTGDFYIKSLNSNNYGISLNTGIINIDSLYGGGYINTTFADVNSKLYSLSKDSEIHSSSGNINLDVNKSFNFSINVSSDVGNIKNDFKSNKISSNSYSLLTVYSGSGDIFIDKSY